MPTACRLHVLVHVIKNAAPPALAVIGLEFAGCSALDPGRDSLFSWPGTGIPAQLRDLHARPPGRQGTVLVLAMFFVLTNVLVDILQMLVDPAIQARAHRDGGHDMTDHALEMPAQGPQRATPRSWVRRRHSYWGGVATRLSREPVTLICAAILIAIVLAAIFAPFLGLEDHTRQRDAAG